MDVQDDQKKNKNSGCYAFLIIILAVFLVFRRNMPSDFSTESNTSKLPSDTSYMKNWINEELGFLVSEVQINLL